MLRYVLQTVQWKRAVLRGLVIGGDCPHLHAYTRLPPGHAMRALSGSPGVIRGIAIEHSLA